MFESPVIDAIITNTILPEISRHLLERMMEGQSVAGIHVFGFGVFTMIDNAMPERTASISELRNNPMATVMEGRGSPVAIIDHDNPVFYCVPTQIYEALLNQLEDMELNAIADSREGQTEIELTLDEL